MKHETGWITVTCGQQHCTPYDQKAKKPELLIYKIKQWELSVREQLCPENVLILKDRQYNFIFNQIVLFVL